MLHPILEEAEQLLVEAEQLSAKVKFKSAKEKLTKARGLLDQAICTGTNDVEVILLRAKLADNDERDQIRILLDDLLKSDLSVEYRSAVLFQRGLTFSDHEQRIENFQMSLECLETPEALDLLADELLSGEDEEVEKGFNLLLEGAAKYPGNREIKSSLGHHILFKRRQELYSLAIQIYKELFEGSEDQRHYHFNYCNLLGLSGLTTELIAEIPKYLAFEAAEGKLVTRESAEVCINDQAWVRYVRELLQEPHTVITSCQLGILAAMLGAGPWFTMEDYYFNQAWRFYDPSATRFPGEFGQTLVEALTGQNTQSPQRVLFLQAQQEAVAMVREKLQERGATANTLSILSDLDLKQMHVINMHEDEENFN